MDRSTPALVRGYSEGIRLMLAYSASDLLGSAIKKKVDTWSLCDKSQADLLRGIARGIPLANAGVTNKELVLDLERFVNGETDNIRIVATALRHMMAHGHFTPTGQKTMTKAGAAALQGLSLSLLNECERLFVEWVDRLDLETAGKT